MRNLRSLESRCVVLNNCKPFHYVIYLRSEIHCIVACVYLSDHRYYLVPRGGLHGRYNIRFFPWSTQCWCLAGQSSHNWGDHLLSAFELIAVQIVLCKILNGIGAITQKRAHLKEKEKRKIRTFRIWISTCLSEMVCNLVAQSWDHFCNFFCFVFWSYHIIRSSMMHFYLLLFWLTSRHFNADVCEYKLSDIAWI